MSSVARKIIISVAPVGTVIRPPSESPVSAREVAQTVISCAQAGASLVHLHVRDSSGDQTADITEFSKVIDGIRETSDIIVQGSTGGLSTLTRDERCVALNDSRVETASLNMGSVNFGDDVYINTLPDIRYWAKRIREACVAPELEIFEAGMVPVIQRLVEEEVLIRPLTINFCVGARWIMPADPRSLFFLASMITEDIPWGVVHAGMKDFSLLATALSLGASIIRVGFEDSVYYAPDKIARTNTELVERITALVRGLGFDVATPAEGRQILGIA